MARLVPFGGSLVGPDAPVDGYIYGRQNDAWTRLGSIATQNASAVAVTGGTIDGTTIGSISPASVFATTLAATSAAPVTANTPLLTLTQTRNNGSVPFHTLEFALTDTAVDPASTAIRVLVGGSPVFVLYDSGIVASTNIVSAGMGLLSGTNVLMDNNPGYVQWSDTNFNNPQLGVDTSNNLALKGTDPSGNPVPIWTMPVANASPTFTFNVPVDLLASAAGSSGLNIGEGVAPSSPEDGDVWLTTAGLWCQAGGTTLGPFGSGNIGGTLAATQVAYGSGTNTITGSASLTFQPTVAAAGQGLHVDTNGTATSGGIYGVHAELHYAPSAATTGTFVAIDGLCSVSASGGVAANGGTLIGVTAETRVESGSTGTFAACYGLEAVVNNQSAATLTAAYGVYCPTPQNSGGGSIGTYAAIRIDALSGATTAYAILTGGAGLVKIQDTTDSTTRASGSVVLSAGLGVGGRGSFNRIAAGSSDITNQTNQLVQAFGYAGYLNPNSTITGASVAPILGPKQSMFQVVGGDDNENAPAAFAIYQYNITGGTGATHRGPQLYFIGSRATAANVAASAFAAVQSSDQIGAIFFGGDNGVNNRLFGAQILATASETWSSTTCGASIFFNVCAGGGSTSVSQILQLTATSATVTSTLSGSSTVAGLQSTITSTMTASASSDAIQGKLTYNPGSASTANYRGVTGVTNANIAANGGQLFGVWGATGLQASATGTFAQCIGVYGIVTNQGAATSTLSAAFYADNGTNTGGGAHTTYAAYYCPAITIGGTNYAFFSAGAGLVRINDTTAATTATSGSISTAGGISTGQGSYFQGKLTLAGANGLNIITSVNISGVPILLSATAPANMGITASTEMNLVSLNLSATQTWATSTPATERAFYIQAPTLACDTAAQTVTTAATVDISGAPIAGANVTITNSYALRVETGNVIFGSSTSAGAVNVTSSAGTGISINSTAGNAQIGFVPYAGTTFLIGSDGNKCFVFDNTATIASFGSFAATISPRANTSGTPTAFTITGAGNSGLTSGTEVFDVYANLNRTVTWATSTPATQRAFVVQGPTLACDTASQTIGTAATFYIGGAPTAGTNVTITNARAFWIGGGMAYFGGPITQGQTATSSGTPVTPFLLNAPANTAITSGTEVFDFELNLNRTVQWTTTTPATQRASVINAPTYSCDTAAQTITTAATLAITGAPAAGTNVTITNAYALWVQGGASQFAAAIGVAGLATFTGTNSVTIAQTATTAAIRTALTVTPGNSTNVTVGTENSQFIWNTHTQQWATGALATQREVVFNAPTYAFVGASTITNAATVAITGAPIAGTNATITTSLALWVQAGEAYFGGQIQCTTPAAYAGTSLQITQGAATSGTPLGFGLTAGAHTTVSSGGEVNDVNFALNRTVQWHTSTPATNRAVLVNNPTYACDTASQTITTAATLAINGAPQAGSNVTITNAYALWVQSGVTTLAGQVNCNGVNAIVATQSVAGSGSPAILKLIGAAHTTLASGTEAQDVFANLARTVQFATSTPATQRAFYIAAPTYSCDTAAQTITTAATLAVNAAPSAGTNVTITNAYTIWAQSGTSRFDGRVIFGGSNSIVVSQLAASSTVVTALSLVGGAHTLVTSGTEIVDVLFNLARTVQFTTTTPTTQRAFYIQAPTYSCDTASQTITTAATLDISGAPIAGTNVTITNTYALRVEGGTSLFTGATLFQSGSTWTAGNAITISQGVNTSGIHTGLLYTGGASTGLTSGTEQNDININMARILTWATTTPTTQRGFLIQAPTYACDTAGQTIATAATLDITGAPIAGTNVTITNSWALRVEAGNAFFGAQVQSSLGSASAANPAFFTNGISTITGGVTDGVTGAVYLQPTYNAASALTVTRHNYIKLDTPGLGGAGPAALTNACVFWFTAAAGTHKAVDGSTTKTTPGGVDAWMKHNVNGTIYYTPMYLSKTA